jgi:hypothetical protein
MLLVSALVHAMRKSRRRTALEEGPTDRMQVLEGLQEARLREFFDRVRQTKLMRTIPDPPLDLPHAVQSR